MHPSNTASSAGARCYIIVVKDELGAAYARAFAGMKLTPAEGKTTIAGPIVDQAQLHGILRRIGSLNLVLLSVNVVDNQLPGLEV